MCKWYLYQFKLKPGPFTHNDRVMTQKPSSMASLRRSYNMDSSDDEAAPVFVFDESSYGIRKKTDASGSVIVKDRPVKGGLIDLDTSNVVPVSKRHVMDAEE